MGLKRAETAKQEEKENGQTTGKKRKPRGSRGIGGTRGKEETTLMKKRESKKHGGFGEYGGKKKQGNYRKLNRGE
jgi:hypothetical protein